jgi:hypothetical protein
MKKMLGDEATSVAGSDSSRQKQCRADQTARLQDGAATKYCKWLQCPYGSCPWSKVDGAQDDLCISTVSFFYSFAVTPAQNKELSSKVQNNEDGEQDKFRERRAAIAECREKAVNMTSARLAGLGLTKCKGYSKVESKSGARTIVKDLKGIAWPIDVFTAKHGPPAKDMISSITVKGVAMNVVVKPRSFGFEDGCEELYEESYEGVELTDRHADSNTVATQKQLDKAGQQAVKSVGVSSKTMRTQDGEEYIKLQPALDAKRKPNEDSDDDEEGGLLSRVRRRRGVSSLCPLNVGASTGGVGQSEQRVNPSEAGSSTGADSQQHVTPKAKTKSRDCSSTTSLTKVPPSKRLREITTSLPIVQEAQTYLRVLAERTGLISNTSVAASRIAAKIAARLTQERQAIYQSGPVQGVQQDPATILSDFKNYKPRLELASTLLDAYQTKKNSAPAPATSLYNAYVGCLSHGMDIHLACLEEVINRAASEAFPHDVSRRDESGAIVFQGVKLVLSTSTMVPSPMRAICMDNFTGLCLGRNLKRLNLQALKIERLQVQVG